jgi:hypothetical protein
MCVENIDALRDELPGRGTQDPMRSRLIYADMSGVRGATRTLPTWALSAELSLR